MYTVGVEGDTGACTTGVPTEPLAPPEPLGLAALGTSSHDGNPQEPPTS